MHPEIGEIIEGRVTGIMKFGAFVALPDGKSGLVHISEIADSYVADVNEFLHVGDPVKVKVIAVTPDGKINLSIKQALPPEERRGSRAQGGQFRDRPEGRTQGRTYSRPDNGGQPYGRSDSRGQSYSRPDNRGQSYGRSDDRGQSYGRSDSRGQSGSRPDNGGQSDSRPDNGGQSYGRRTEGRTQSRGEVSGPSDNAEFESKLKRFMQESDSRISDNPIYADHTKKTRRR